MTWLQVFSFIQAQLYNRWWLVQIENLSTHVVLSLVAFHRHVLSHFSLEKIIFHCWEIKNSNEPLLLQLHGTRTCVVTSIFFVFFNFFLHLRYSYRSQRCPHSLALRPFHFQNLFTHSQQHAFGATSLVSSRHSIPIWSRDRVLFPSVSYRSPCAALYVFLCFSMYSFYSFPQVFTLGPKPLVFVFGEINYICIIYLFPSSLPLLMDVVSDIHQLWPLLCSPFSLCYCDVDSPLAFFISCIPPVSQVTYLF